MKRIDPTAITLLALATSHMRSLNMDDSMPKPTSIRIVISAILLVFAAGCGEVSVGSEADTTPSPTAIPAPTPVPMSVCASYNLFMSNYNAPVINMLVYSQPPDGRLAGDPIFKQINDEVIALREDISRTYDRVPQNARDPWSISIGALKQMENSFIYYLNAQEDPLPPWKTPIPPWVADAWDVGVQYGRLNVALNDPIFASC